VIRSELGLVDDPSDQPEQRGDRAEAKLGRSARYCVAMSQESIWHLNIGFVGSGEDGGRADEIIIRAPKRGKPVYGEGPWWSVAYENVESRGAALAALSNDLDEIDPGWRDVLEIR
jgi:hypothetical protein